MDAEVHDVPECEVDEKEAWAALERLFADARFKVAERQKAILRYLTERRFDGGESAKAYSIAVDVLGRPSNFDTSLDPIVRIEISRLRSSLDNYYMAFGSEDGITISIQKGKYVACFTRAAAPCASKEDAGQSYEPADRKDVLRNRSNETEPTRRVERRMLAALAVAIMAALAIGTYLLLDVSVVSGKPTVYVSVQAASPELAGEASQTRDMLLTALTQFQTLTVAKPGYASARSNAADRRYAIELKYYGDGDDRSVWWQVVDNGSGDLLKSGVERVETSGKSIIGVREEIVGLLAKRIAAERGLISTIEMATRSGDALGNACVMRAEYALDEGRSVAAARQCLERTLELAPDDPDANALLARVLIAPKGRATDGASVSRGLTLAKRAVSASPLSDRAYIALMDAQMASGRLEAAIEAGNRAMALNPNNPDNAAALAWVLYSAGYREAGLSIARDASKDSDVVPRDAMVVLALDAYRSGQFSEASLLAEQINGGDPLVVAIRVASLGELGSSQAKESLGNAKDFERGFRQNMTAIGVPTDLVGMLISGLSKAGADFDADASIAP